MSTASPQSHSTVIPCLRYRNAPAAMEWLCATFGFEKQHIIANEDGTIAHAQLTFGTGMIMLATVSSTEYGQYMKQPDEIGGSETQTAYVFVPDADVVYHRAKAAGATIVVDIRDENYPGRLFTCRDLEGHIWTIGTFDPWKTD
jgi:uncharacterized glyoxalase superfamily protein PhnB